jgi:intracellular sulfur oxidation DsrE/DsrF family protein
MNPDHERDLNAFVDDELSPDQQAEFLYAMRRDPDLAREVCAVGRLKAQIRLAYLEPPVAQTPRPRAAPARWQAAVAGAALLAVGLVGGWLMHDSRLDTPTATPQRLVLLDADGRGQAPARPGVEETRIVFHVTQADPEIAGELLDEIENMLQVYAADHRPLRVEVVTHSDGLDLLRRSLTRHESRIHRLAQAFDNLAFVACQNTIDRLRVERGIEVDLVPEAEVIESGVNHVVQRQRQGWAYIRV